MNDHQLPQLPFPRTGFPLLILRWLISTIAIFVATWIVPGITFQGPGWQLGIVGMCFGLLNVLVRPLNIMLIIVTFGLFALVANAFLLILTATVCEALGIRFTVDDFWSALLGGLIISLVTIVLSHLAGDRRLYVQITYKGPRRPE